MDTTRIRLTEKINADLFVADGVDFDPETLAMLQAFYSRSIKSIGDRTENMDSAQVKESLSKYYVGYGHRSIGQCANFTVFLEDVSIFAAKAIQHHPLYNGQETSTRYYNFTERPVVTPFEGESWNDGYVDYVRRLYSVILNHATSAYLERARSAKETELTDAEKRAAKASAFDVARAFLTAGFTTKLSWTTNFDQVQEQLAWLINSPAPELNTIGLSVAEMLHTRYPKAIKDPVDFKSAYLRDCANVTFFDNTERMYVRARSNDRHWWFEENTRYGVNFSAKVPHLEPLWMSDDEIALMRGRNRGEAVPRSFSRYGTYSLFFDIDYGSFRDLHRHRNGNVYFPSYPTDRKLHGWYHLELEQLDILDKPGVGRMNVRDSIEYLYLKLLPSVEDKVAASNPVGSQAHSAAMMYYVPMGTIVKAAMRYDLPQAIYVSELRSARTVHATARLVARSIANAIRYSMPHDIPIHTDSFEGIDSSRGNQTIMERDTNKVID